MDCEVLVVDKPRKLSYTWASAGESTIITWSLKKDTSDTTLLNLEQTGFSEATKAREGAINGAKFAWRNMGDQLEKVLTSL